MWSRTTRGLVALLALAGCSGTSPEPLDAGAIEEDLGSIPTVDLATADMALLPDHASPCGVCAAPTPLCDPGSGHCVACLADGDCGMGKLCVEHQCIVRCLGDGDCRDARLPACEVASGLCRPCLPGNDRCPPGSWCSQAGADFTCVPGCKDDAECQAMNPAARCCNHSCIDTAADRSNCGACGKACGADTCCAGACTALDGDAKNCGACGNACKPPHALPSCAAGRCGVAGCEPGWADCNVNATDGCEVSIASDAQNCGGCGRTCSAPNGSANCIGGQCALVGCNPGFRNCDANPANGCEIDSRTDPLNCGGCGVACGQLPHAMAGCMGGACVIAACAAGWGNCDKVDNNGCEADLANDFAHCGGCGMACPAPPHVQTSCANKVCMQGGCATGFGDCNMNLADGCEVDLRVDLKNCGGCGKACAAGANAVASCANSACVIQCNAGFADCNGNPADGCEVATDADARNCGKCGVVCANNEACRAGACVPAALRVLIVQGFGDAALQGFLNGFGYQTTIVPGGQLGANYDYSKYDVVGVMYDSTVADTARLLAQNTGGKLGIVCHRCDALQQTFDLGGPGFWQQGAFAVTDAGHYITNPFLAGPVDLFYMYKSIVNNPGASVRVLGTAPSASLVVHKTWRRVVTPYYGHAVGMPWSPAGETITRRTYEWAAGIGNQ